MNRAEATQLLALIQSFDHRNVGEADTYAWWRALDDVPFEPACDAVIEHYRESREWLMPSDVRNGISRIDYRRRGHLRAIEQRAEFAAEGLTEADVREPNGPTVAWKELGDKLRQRAGVEFKSPEAS